MSADLKRVMHRVRTNKPHYFQDMKVSEMDGEGKVTYQCTTRAQPIKPRDRHALSLSNKRF